MPPNNVVPFPHPHVVITFPLSKFECDILNQHLRERSPEILDNIEDTIVRDVVWRFMDYVWRECKATAPILAKSAGWLYIVAVSHIHSFGYISALDTLIRPGLA